ncbi:MAG: hypothetical protein AAGG75_03220 [Bacteroidota bacterium]
MAAYLSKIAARFNGSSSVAASSEPSGLPTMMPNQPRFIASEIGDGSTAFFETASPWTAGEERIAPSVSTEPSSLHPSLNEPRPYFESVHTVVHRDILKKEQYVQPTQQTNQYFIETPIEEGRTGEELSPASTTATGLPLTPVKNIQRLETIVEKENITVPAIPQPVFERQDPVQPTLNPVTNSHVINPVSSIAPVMTNAPSSSNLSKLSPPQEKGIQQEEVILQKQTTEQFAAEAKLKTPRSARLLRPQPLKQAALPTPKATSKSESVLRIGSIKVEILPPAPPAVRTVPRQPPRPAATKPIPSVNKPRFPQRFGLGQM